MVPLHFRDLFGRSHFLQGFPEEPSSSCKSLERNLWETRRGWAKCPHVTSPSTSTQQCPGDETWVWGWGTHQEAGEMLIFPEFISGWEEQLKQRLLGCRCGRGGEGRELVSVWASHPSPSNHNPWVGLLHCWVDLRFSLRGKTKRFQAWKFSRMGLLFYSIYLPLSAFTAALMNLLAPRSGRGEIALQSTSRRHSHRVGLGGNSKLDLLKKIYYIYSFITQV